MPLFEVEVEVTAVFTRRFKVEAKDEEEAQDLAVHKAELVFTDPPGWDLQSFDRSAGEPEEITEDQRIIYKQDRYNQFVDEMESAGYEVREYEGRGFYKGPAVSCGRNDLHQVIKATSVSVRYDNLGLGYIVYPQ